MNKFLKIFFLVVMLAIPLAIFIFLRLFGDNKFDIPVYYEEGIKDEVTTCAHEDKPFLVPDSLVVPKKHTVVLFYSEERDFNAMTLSNQVRRLHDLFGEDTPQIMIYTTGNTTLKEESIQVRNRPKDILEQVMQCGFVLKEFNQYVLVDRKQRIRGYYGTDLEEVDRLIVEIKILLENGTNE